MDAAEAAVWQLPLSQRVRDRLAIDAFQVIPQDEEHD
eukprot:CAMPEP_0115335414 /NCGR_PEP_ID=MMETSP0270-20121206/88445_1 /TAXON_ID=71861 /ORGANISM="Scrippsiella trochoidea, Strain CCMP3099" /LENGTH=36 /DNA_ID= /DNA_START= /DNA_END= /DNA_ORIENTATION=